MKLRFKPYNGDLIKLPTSINHLNFRWLEPNCKVLFSVCKQGESANIHVASDKRGIPKLEKALNEFCDFCFYIFDWCKMIIGNIRKKSIMELAKKCKFFRIATSGETYYYVRPKGGSYG